MQPAVKEQSGPGAGVLAEELYERLRRDIVDGRLRPNERLVESELAERLGASRTPIRETLQRLARERLVARRRGGWVVQEHTEAEIREIYEVRAALEGYAAYLAAERAGTVELEALESLYPPGERALELPFDVQVELNEAFHDGVIAAARNSRLAELCRGSRQYYFNYRIAKVYGRDDARLSLEGHRRILRALRARDPQAAEAAAREHVRQALQIVLAKLA